MNLRRASKFATITSVLLMMQSLSGCVGLAVVGVQQMSMPSAEETEQLQKSIVNGVTTKAELIEKFGAPIHDLNESSVLIFGGRHRPRGLVQLVTEDKQNEPRLIAVVDPSGLLLDHFWFGHKKKGIKAATVSAVTP